jgi:multimeric flavodoxin WrbA
MQQNKSLLVVFHSRSGNTASMAEAVIGGAQDSAIEGVDVLVSDALTTRSDQVLSADGVILGTPENFGYMSGAMKVFLETVYYDCLERTQGLPYGIFIHAGNDGSGALSSMTRIISGLRWRQVIEPVIVVGDTQPPGLEACRELGMSLAAGLESGIF